MVMSKPGSASELEAAVLDALRNVTVGEDGPDLVAAGHVTAVAATGGAVRVLIEPDLVDDEAGDARGALLNGILGELPGGDRGIVRPPPTPAAARTPSAGRPLTLHTGRAVLPAPASGWS